MHTTASPEGMSMNKHRINPLAWTAAPLVTLAWLALPMQAMAQDRHHRDYAPPPSHYEHDRYGHDDRDDR